jgi:type III secretion protein V
VTLTRDRTLAALRARAADFLGLAEVQRLLDELEQFAPATVRNVVPRPVSLVLLADVLRRLVEERLSIRDLRAVLEALSTVAATEKDPLSLTEHVRAQLRRTITFQLTVGASELGVVLLDPVLEDTVRRAITRTPAGAFLALPPQASRDVRASVRRALESLPEPAAGDGPRAILTQPDIRRFVRKLLETDAPDVWVVSFAELLPEVAIKPLARAVP